MIEPVRKDQALLADIAAATPGDGFALWWLGQSGFLLKHRDRHLLFNPYLSDSLTEKYANSDKPHVRMTRRAVDPRSLSFVDIATFTHNHTDHLDADTLKPLLATNPALTLVIPEANRAFVAERLGCDPDSPVGVDDGVSASVNGFEIHGIAAAHERLNRDGAGRHRCLVYVVRFGSWTIYHSGDTLLYDGLVARLRRFDIDVAILPINGRRPERRVTGNLDGAQAAGLAHDVRAHCVVPCHFEMFTFNTEPPDVFVAACERLGQCHRVLRCGERLDSVELPGRTGA